MKAAFVWLDLYSSGEGGIAVYTAACNKHSQIEERIVTNRWSVKREQIQAGGVIQICACINAELGSGA